MKTHLVFLAIVAMLLGACSKDEPLQITQLKSETVEDNHGLMSHKTAVITRHWISCQLSENKQGEKCVFGGRGCGGHINTPRCAARNRSLEALFDQLDEKETATYYSGEFTVDFVQNHYEFFVGRHNLDLGTHPDEIIEQLQAE